MTGSCASITQLERGIARRMRLLAVQNLLALAGFLAAALAVVSLVLAKLGLFEGQISEGAGIRERLVLCGVPLLACIVLLLIRGTLSRRGRWHSRLDAPASQVDIAIDRALGLEDRASTAGSIIRRGGPVGVMEQALVADTASRLNGVSPNQIVEYQPPRLRPAMTCPASASLAIVLALIVAVVVIQYQLATRGNRGPDPGTVAVMQEVGNNLEESSRAIEKSLDQNTPTAALAKQQADLAHGLKQSGASGRNSSARPIDKSQALKELSALEEKLGARKDQLESTKAPEIIGLAERRFQPALSGTTRLNKRQGAARLGGDRTETADASRPEKAPPPGNRSLDEKTVRPEGAELKSDSTAAVGQARTDKSSPAAGMEPRYSGSPESSRGQKDTESTQGTGAADQAKTDAQAAEATTSDTPREAPKDQTKETSLPTGVADGLAAAAPSLSQNLIKKAAEMRAGNLTAADIEQFRRAAEGLLKDLSAKDLANLANSKEIQQTLEQLARQVDPKQMEQLARQLLSQKEIRDELQAVGKLLTENRQAKETIAGFADKAREIAEQFQKQGFRPEGSPNSVQAPLDPLAQAGSGAGSEPGSGLGEAKRGYRRTSGGAEGLKGMGRSSEGQGGPPQRSGLIDSKTEGQSIYGSSRPGAEPARVPYSSAYPGYRREAERTVQRSQVPPRLRILVRSYFDRINPDVEKRP